MKRDMDLVRNILIAIEKTDGEVQSYSKEELGLDEIPDNSFFYHVQILDEAHLIKAENMSSIVREEFYPMRLTWQGHEFLDLIKKDTNWNKAKEVMAQTGGMAFEILIKILMQYAAGQVGLL